MLKIQQLRKGFAHNSSSAHSIVFLKKGDSDILFDKAYYGWDQFLLVSPEEKTKYLAAQYHLAISSILGEQAAIVVTSGYFGFDGTANIDHQSVMSFPRLHDGSLATEFIKDSFQSFITNDKVGIAGGNDNGGGEIHEGRPDIPFPDNYGGSIARKEEDGTWVVFNRRSGNKVRYTPDFVSTDNNKKATTPELVDIKITDYCSFGCSFCYQDSTTKGKHGSLEAYKKLIDKLRDLKVFEVAIGGGEPTEHPDFGEMLQYTRSKGIIPNFTTRSTAWLDTPLKEIVYVNGTAAEGKGVVGSFAVSCDAYSDFVRKQKAFEEFYDKVYFQFVTGVTPQEEFEKVIKAKGFLGFNLSLVGFKRTGRAGESLPLDGKILYDLLSKDFEYVSVDVSFLQQHPNFSQEMTCDTQEGRHSMYVDLVEDKMARSSYCEEKAPLDLDRLDDYFQSL